ncbi:uncharacterized protein I303_104859 [Kwoniella dejecticola CBS 10117]|uniref:WSC domain-containing protein n=1 Tax=Kwoniella dejecticola CBS 10117 TaxID=1296121 RepID=A0A1A6A454_9TREE|nr:uncharacterized protein I303_04158 [Kwoniella dejecticola CBS 10117]OBR84837.1 hypothetical protein I303_04158 [Kwoniella dejecticola CBS 10117]
MLTTTLLSLLFATAVANAAVLGRRAVSNSTSAKIAVTPSLPSGWSDSGVCISEVTNRALTGVHYSDLTGMTQLSCASYCSSNGYTLAGLQFSQECWCGSVLSNGASLYKTSTSCNMPCKGDSSTLCGGRNAISLLVSNTALSTLSADLTTAPLVLPSGWSAASSSCIAEPSSGKALTGARWADNSMTINTCVSYCQTKGFVFAGVEYGRECYCGNALVNGASLDKASSACTKTCASDSAHTCGGSNALQLYFNAPSLPDGWSAAATTCVAEGSSGRALASASFADDSMTISKCLNYCQTQGFQYGGVEYGRECYCGDSLVNGASLSSPSTNCNTPCAGDSSRTCGGGNALQLYKNPSLALNLQQVGSYTYQGCIMEVGGRALTGSSLVSNDMSIETCTSFCQSGGFQLAGVEYGTECYCANSFANGGSASNLSTQCYMKCAGNNKENCGGPNAIALWTAPASQ